MFVPLLHQIGTIFIFKAEHQEEEKAVIATCTTQSEWVQDDVYVAVCPAGCTSSNILYGTGTYSDDSYICAAAIHDGRISGIGIRKPIE